MSTEPDSGGGEKVSGEKICIGDDDGTSITVQPVRHASNTDATRKFEVRVRANVAEMRILLTSEELADLREAVDSVRNWGQP